MKEKKGFFFYRKQIANFVGIIVIISASATYQDYLTGKNYKTNKLVNSYGKIDDPIPADGIKASSIKEILEDNYNKFGEDVIFIPYKQQPLIKTYNSCNSNIEILIKNQGLLSNYKSTVIYEKITNYSTKTENLSKKIVHKLPILSVNQRGIMCYNQNNNSNNYLDNIYCHDIIVISSNEDKLLEQYWFKEKKYGKGRLNYCGDKVKIKYKLFDKKRKSLSSSSSKTIIIGESNIIPEIEKAILNTRDEGKIDVILSIDRIYADETINQGWSFKSTGDRLGVLEITVKRI